jgi:hypothetical protein
VQRGFRDAGLGRDLSERLTLGLDKSAVLDAVCLVVDTRATIPAAPEGTR